MKLCLWEYMWTTFGNVFGLKLHCSLPPGSMKWFSTTKSFSSFSSLHSIPCLSSQVFCGPYLSASCGWRGLIELSGTIYGNEKGSGMLSALLCVTALCRPLPECMMESCCPPIYSSPCPGQKRARKRILLLKTYCWCIPVFSSFQFIRFIAFFCL